MVEDTREFKKKKPRTVFACFSLSSPDEGKEDDDHWIIMRVMSLRRWIIRTSFFFCPWIYVAFSVSCLSDLFFHISSLHCTPKIYSKQNFQSSAQTNLHLTFTPKSFTCTRILLLLPCLFVYMFWSVCVFLSPSFHISLFHFVWLYSALFQLQSAT